MVTDLAHPATVIWLVCAEALLAGIGAHVLVAPLVLSGALLDLGAYVLYTCAAALAPHSAGWLVASFALSLPAAHALCGLAPALRTALGLRAQQRVLLDAWAAASVAYALALLLLTGDVGEKGSFAFWPLYAWCVGSFTFYGAISSRLSCAAAFAGDDAAGAAAEQLPPGRGAAAPANGACPALGAVTAALPAVAARALITRSAMAQTALVWAHRLARAAQRGPLSASAGGRAGGSLGGGGGRRDCGCAGLTLPLTSAACALAVLYGCSLRAKTWAPSVLCSPVPTLDDEACEAGRPAHALAIGEPDSLLRAAGLHRWAYGAHTADATPFERVRRSAPPAAPPRLGLVIAARGDAWQYAQPVVVCVHVLRAGLASPIGIEVLHVGAQEAFTPAAKALLESYGKVVVDDMLPRLRPSVRAYAGLLRSFAAKPYALLAAECELCVLCDSNVLFVQSPHLLFGGAGQGALLGSGARGARGARRGGGSGEEEGGGGGQQLEEEEEEEEEGGEEGGEGIVLFSDYVRMYRTLDPLFVAMHLGLDTSLLAAATLGSEIDSSIVALDKRRAMPALLATAALNRLRPLTYRHMHGDKDSWALGAALAGVARPVSRRTQVGWLVRAAPSRAGARARAPAETDAAGAAARAEAAAEGAGAAATETVWGHVQLLDGQPLSLNWQPHYARGFIDFVAAAEQGGGDERPGGGSGGGSGREGGNSGGGDVGGFGGLGGRREELHCCALFREHGQGPHDLLHPPIPRAADGTPAGLPPTLVRTFAAARDAIALVAAAEASEAAAAGRPLGIVEGGSRARASQRASAWSDVALRKLVIYAALTLVALCGALVRLPAALRAMRPQLREAVAAARGAPPRSEGQAAACFLALRWALVLAGVAAAGMLLTANGSRAVRVPLFFDSTLGALASFGQAAGNGGSGSRLLAAVERWEARSRLPPRSHGDGAASFTNGDKVAAAAGDGQPQLWASTVHVTARNAAKADSALGAWRALGLKTQVADDAQARRDVARAFERLGLPGALDVYDRAPTAVLRADLWRLAIVWLEGGLYADSDVEPRPRLRALLEAMAALPATRRGDDVARPGLLLFVENWSFIPTLVGRIAIAVGLSDFSRFPQYRNCIFAAAAPGHALLEAALRLALSRLENEERTRAGTAPADARILELTGPGLLTDATDAYLAAHGLSDVAFIDRGSGMAFFIHAGVGSWKAGAVKSGHTERLLLGIAGVVLALCQIACEVFGPFRRARKLKVPHSME